MINCIVCVDNNWAIGKNNGLLFDLKEDMKFFREMTKNKIVVCGLNTLLSFPNSKPLKNRSTIVICPEDYNRDDCYCIHNFDELVKLTKELAKTQEVFIIGGAYLYQSFLPYYDRVFVTKVDAEDLEATAFFPNLDKENFVITNESESKTENDLEFKFVIYEPSKEVTSQEPKELSDQAFAKIRWELDQLPANSSERSKKAIEYLEYYNLPKTVILEDIIKYFALGTDLKTWKWLYLIERSIPYYTTVQPEWQQRLLYFASTYIFEVKTLLNQKFKYNDTEVKLLFSRHSGSHEALSAGPNKASAPDFYIYSNNGSFGNNKAYLYIDFKFASINRFKTIDEVYDYYSKGQHLHGSKLLLSFLEATEKYYLIDYLTNTYYELNLPKPVSYLTTEDIYSFKDPLELIK